MSYLNMQQTSFNFVWIIIVIVIFANIFLFTFLSRNVSKYMADTQAQRYEKYADYGLDTGNI